MKKQNKIINVCQKITDAFKVETKQTKKERSKEMNENLKKVVLYTAGGIGLDYLTKKL